jgi:hypothetical protein
MNELILGEKYEDLVVVNLPNGISFVHNNETGKNFFNQNAISRITGLTQGRISKAIRRYNEEIEDITNSNILLKVLNSRAPVKFYDFDVVTYIVYRSDKLEAIQMRKYISDAIDERFNRDVGFQKPLVQRLADAMNVDKVEQAERIKELESQVRSLGHRLGNQRALEREVVSLKEDVVRANVEIADLYGQLSTMKGNYWKRELKKVQSLVNHSLDEWR